MLSVYDVVLTVTSTTHTAWASRKWELSMCLHGKWEVQMRTGRVGERWFWAFPGLAEGGDTGEGMVGFSWFSFLTSFLCLPFSCIRLSQVSCGAGNPDLLWQLKELSVKDPVL